MDTIAKFVIPFRLLGRIENPFPRPKYSGVGLPTSALIDGIFAHHPDPNNKNYPLCWQGVNRIETGDVKSMVISWIPEMMTCQDCREWLHA